LFKVVGFFKVNDEMLLLAVGLFDVLSVVVDEAT
jgi:hypothetical protein